MTVHATAVAFGADAVLIRGPSGAGKSDLALRLLALPREALAAFGIDDCGRVALVADDRVELARQGNDIVATSPASLLGMLEVRGIGIVDGVRIADRAVVRLVVDLVASGQVERMPREGASAVLLEVTLPRLEIAATEASASLKVALALARVYAWSATRQPE